MNAHSGFFRPLKINENQFLKVKNMIAMSQFMSSLYYIEAIVNSLPLLSRAKECEICVKERHSNESSGQSLQKMVEK